MKKKMSGRSTSRNGIAGGGSSPQSQRHGSKPMIGKSTERRDNSMAPKRTKPKMYG